MSAFSDYRTRLLPTDFLDNYAFCQRQVDFSMKMTRPASGDKIMHNWVGGRPPVRNVLDFVSAKTGFLFCVLPLFQELEFLKTFSS
jgi:hypothetical protein